MRATPLRHQKLMAEGWDRAAWERLGCSVSACLDRADSEAALRDGIVRGSRAILRSFSSSFFLVTRFLPKPKRSDVEVIYAAVRYPDEIVDTFPLQERKRLEMLDEWERWYTLALRRQTIRERLSAGVPWILAGFAGVVHRNGIPQEHYGSFLDAMRRDVRPAPFQTVASLIDDYIYGSAVVVGYFLAHVYGTPRGHTMALALFSSRELGIALQLTNFARDVADDASRGRLYLPLDQLACEGLTAQDYLRRENAPALRRTIVAMAEEAERRYRIAAETLDAFAPDCRTAIRACIDVYRGLNSRLLTGSGDPAVRQSVPASEKFRALPPSKYWRVPLAYLGAL